MEREITDKVKTSVFLYEVVHVTFNFTRETKCLNINSLFYRHSELFFI